MEHDNDKYEKLLEKAAKYASRAEKAPRDIIEKLYSWSGGNISPSMVQKILNVLKQERFIDQERYARAFVYDKRVFSYRGPYRIRRELIEKGIDEETVEEALSEVAYEQWEETLEVLLANKQRTTKYKNSYDLQNKLFRAAFDRGFASDMIRDAIENLDLWDSDTPSTNEDWYD